MSSDSIFWAFHGIGRSCQFGYCHTKCHKTFGRKPMSNAKDAVRKILDQVKADKRTSLTAPEGKVVCDAYGIPVPGKGVARSAAEAAGIATGMGYPVVMK